MLDISILEKSWFFKIKTLCSGEVLFDEWDLDDNLYIIKSWELLIEKYTSLDRNETKILAILWKEEIFWEGSLNNNEPKQVKITASQDSILLSIEAKKDFENFLLKNTKIAINLLSNIILSSNKRLLEANFLITSSYKINKYISEITEFNNKNLFKIIDEFSKVVKSKYVLYLEKNPVLDNVVNLKYDTRSPWKMKELIIDMRDSNFDLDDLKQENIKLDKYNIIENLKNWNIVIWYLVIWEENQWLDEWQKKAISTIAVAIAWYIKQKQYFEENRDKEYSE